MGRIGEAVVKHVLLAILWMVRRVLVASCGAAVILFVLFVVGIICREALPDANSIDFHITFADAFFASLRIGLVSAFAYAVGSGTIWGLRGGWRTMRYLFARRHFRI
jgi:hypothetical protein